MMMAFRKLNSSYRGLLSKACLKKQTGTSSLLTSQQARLCAAECGTYTHIEQDGVHQAVAILKMNNKPFNGFNKPFLDEMSHRLDELRSTGSCQGIIITSANAGIFSAGLDISEIYQISQDCAAALWRSLIEFIMRLYGTNLVTVAAVNGHATAGGCLLSLSCDYRIMAEGPHNSILGARDDEQSMRGEDSGNKLSKRLPDAVAAEGGGAPNRRVLAPGTKFTKMETGALGSDEDDIRETSQDLD